MIEIIKKNEFDQVFSIMEISFPSDEYRTYAEQKALLDEELYSVYALKDLNNGAVKAFIAVWEFDDFAFVEHLAVSPEYRNSGFGASILSDIIEMLDKPLCLEVEPPDDEIKSRRIGFYERNKFYLNHYPYIQPSMSKGKNPIPLMIMTTGGAIDREKFEHYKSVLYEKVYKCEESR